MADKSLDDDLDLFFAAARDGDRRRYGPPADDAGAAPAGLDGFLARVEADALAEQALRLQGVPLLTPAPQAAPGPVGRLRGWVAQLWSDIGGWPSLAGLATATVAGVWIGVSPPAVLSAQAAVLTGESSTLDGDLYLVDLMPGLYYDLTSSTDG